MATIDVTGAAGHNIVHERLDTDIGHTSETLLPDTYYDRLIGSEEQYDEAETMIMDDCRLLDTIELCTGRP
jgi:hypothetical protein